MTAPYLATLNPEQRHAVEYIGDQPLLIIAGAGSGKTNTLAHRVAHLIVQRADPRRMMLLTFSRRAAAEIADLEEELEVRLQERHRGGGVLLNTAGLTLAAHARSIFDVTERLSQARRKGRPPHRPD
jgi:ATP-dependent DNA helicase UvrD/PcrA